MHHHARVASLVSLFLLVALKAPSASAQCSSGLDVRNINDADVSDTLRNSIYAPGPVVSVGNPKYPSGKMVVIRAASTDWPANSSVSTAYVHKLFFTDVPNQKSVRGYYKSNSYGKLILKRGSIPPWFSLPFPLTDYATGVEANPEYMHDVLGLAHVNWSALDKDKDHKISQAEAQIVMLIPNALPYEGLASARTVAIDSVTTPDGVYDFQTRPIVYFSVKAMTHPTATVDPIRTLATIVHELGHAFFDLLDRHGDTDATAAFDIMGYSGSWLNYTMADRMKIGWIRPKIVQGHLGQCLQFPASDLLAAALVIVPIQQFLAPTGVLEYWVVEHRNKDYSESGYDSDLPGTGIAVWYVADGVLGGFSDVRLIDATEPDQIPALYDWPDPGALFTKANATSSRLFLDRSGAWPLMRILRTSDTNLGISPGLFMYAEF